MTASLRSESARRKMILRDEQQVLARGGRSAHSRISFAHAEQAVGGKAARRSRGLFVAGALALGSRTTQQESPVDFVPKNAAPRHDGAVQATAGEFAGWWTWTRDNFEVHNGPFWHREEDGGAVRCAFRLEKKHLNGSSAAHGGCLMSFADYCLFAIGNKVLMDGRGVTLSFTSEFLDAAYEGELIEGHGEVVRAGRSILFLRGTLTSSRRPVLTFSATIKRINAARRSG